MIPLYTSCHLNRVPLREKSKVLLDPIDYEDFKDLLAGKEVKSSGGKGKTIF